MATPAAGADCGATAHCLTISSRSFSDSIHFLPTLWPGKRPARSSSASQRGLQRRRVADSSRVKNSNAAGGKMTALPKYGDGPLNVDGRWLLSLPHSCRSRTTLGRPAADPAPEARPAHYLPLLADAMQNVYCTSELGVCTCSKGIIRRSGGQVMTGFLFVDFLVGLRALPTTSATTRDDARSRWP